MWRHSYVTATSQWQTGMFKHSYAALALNIILFHFIGSSSWKGCYSCCKPWLPTHSAICWTYLCSFSYLFLYKFLTATRNELSNFSVSRSSLFSTLEVRGNRTLRFPTISIDRLMVFHYTKFMVAISVFKKSLLGSSDFNESL